MPCSIWTNRSEAVPGIRPEVDAPGAGTRAPGRRPDAPQSARRRGGREKRPEDRPGLAQKSRRTPRRSLCAAASRRGRARRHALRHAGALLHLRTYPALHRRRSPQRHRAGRRRHGRSQPQARRPRPAPAAQGGRANRRRRVRRRSRRAPRAVRLPHVAPPTVFHAQARALARWPDRRPHPFLALDHGAGCAGHGPGHAARVRRHPGRRRHGPARQPFPVAPAGRKTKALARGRRPPRPAALEGPAFQRRTCRAHDRRGAPRLATHLRSPDPQSRRDRPRIAGKRLPEGLGEGIGPAWHPARLVRRRRHPRRRIDPRRPSR